MLILKVNKKSKKNIEEETQKAIISEKRIEIHDYLIDLINKLDEKEYKKIKIKDNKDVYIKYVPLKYFRSYKLEYKKRIYLFIKEQLSDKEKENELEYFLNGKLDNFTIKECKKNIREYEINRNMPKLINLKDIDRILKNITYGEINDTQNFLAMLKQYINDYDDSCRFKSVYFYALIFKLGNIQGKREERARRRKNKNNYLSKEELNFYKVINKEC